MSCIPCLNRSNHPALTPMEDSVICKFITSIPVLGLIPIFLNENAIANRIRSSMDSSHTVRYIEVKNHYKIASIIRELLAIAVIATLMAVGILHGTYALTASGICIAVCGGVVAVHSYRIHHNKQMAQDIGQKGLNTPREIL